MSICDSSNCTSCMACYNACIKNCITMKPNEYGTLEPIINKDICINCNLCSLCCPVNNKVDRNNSMEAYACWSLDNDDRKSSSSGGIASIFYTHFINGKNGICYGCSYDNDLQLIYSRASTLEEIKKFKTSKYSFSHTGKIFKEIEKDLKNNLHTIFIGTPCQVAGLKKYLRKDYDNLLTIDLICHGMPPQKYLDEYVELLNLEEKPNRLTFRGILDFHFSLYNDDKLLYSKQAQEDLFFKAFLDGLFYNENCYSCQYANSERVGDITVGDFWGLGKEKPFNHETKNGVSVVLINNNKGKEYFEEIKDKIFYEQRTVSEAVAGNDQLQHPSAKHINHDAFLKLYSEKDLKEALEKTLL